MRLVTCYSMCDKPGVTIGVTSQASKAVTSEVLKSTVIDGTTSEVSQTAWKIGYTQAAVTTEVSRSI